MLRSVNGKARGSSFRPITFFLSVFLSILAVAACRTSSLSPKEYEPTIMNHEKTTVVKYVALGDSTGVGVGAREGGYVIRLFNRISRERPSSHLTNLCFSGAESRDVLSEQLEPGIAARPTLVTIGIGINDVARGVTEESYARNLEEIILRLKSETSASIVITNLPDVSLAPIVPLDMRGQLSSRINSFNQKITEVVNRHGLFVIDTYSATHELIPRHPEFFSADEFHPSDMGYEYWANLMWPTVQRAIDK